MSTNMVRNNPPIMAAIQKNILEHISLMAQEQIQLEFREQLMQMQQMQQAAAQESNGCTTATTDDSTDRSTKSSVNF